MMKTNKNLLLISLVFCSFIFGASLNGQTSMFDEFIKEVKLNMFNFLYKQGILQEMENFDQYEKRTFTYELVNKSKIGTDTFGIYGLGVHTSHTKNYIVVIDKFNYRIFDPDSLLSTCLGCLHILDKNHASQKQISEYLNGILNIYLKNQNRGEGILKNCQPDSNP